MILICRRKLEDGMPLCHSLVLDFAPKCNHKHSLLEQYEQTNLPYKNSHNPCHIQ